MTRVFDVSLRGKVRDVDFGHGLSEVKDANLTGDVRAPDAFSMVAGAPVLRSAAVSVSAVLKSRNPRIVRGETRRMHVGLAASGVIAADVSALPIRYRIIPWKALSGDARRRAVSAVFAENNIAPHCVEFVGVASAPLERALRLEVSELSGTLLLYLSKEKRPKRGLSQAVIAMNKDTREPLIAALPKDIVERS